MWCFIHRWNISRSIDSGAPAAERTRRHLEKCAPCREFGRLSRDLEKRLAADAADLIGSADASLAGRVMPTAAAGGPVESLSSLPTRSKPVHLRPVWAAAASLAVVIGISLIWVVGSRPAKIPALDPLFNLDGPRAYLENALQKAESPYEEELLELRQTLESTADYLLNRLDVNLGPEN